LKAKEWMKNEEKDVGREMKDVEMEKALPLGHYIFSRLVSQAYS
jgi:hypothetical protein